MYVSSWAPCSIHTAIRISKGPSFLLKSGAGRAVELASELSGMS